MVSRCQLQRSVKTSYGCRNVRLQGAFLFLYIAKASLLIFCVASDDTQAVSLWQSTIARPTCCFTMGLGVTMTGALPELRRAS